MTSIPYDPVSPGDPASPGPTGVSSSKSPAEAEVSTSERLREIAIELFAERGYAGTSLAEIAARLGIRKPSLYNHFRSKEQLFLELFEDSLEAWKKASRPALALAMGAGSERQAPNESGFSGIYAQSLYRHLRGAVGFAVESPHAVALCRVAVSQITGSLGNQVQDLLNRHRQDTQAALIDFFEEARRAGEVVDRPAIVLALAWRTFLEGVLTHHLFGPVDSREDYLQSIDELWRLFFRGIAAQREA